MNEYESSLGREFFDKYEAFLDDHQEFTEEHKDRPASPHKPQYPVIDTTAEEEFNVYCALSALSEKELYFAYALLTDTALCSMVYSDKALEDMKS